MSRKRKKNIFNTIKGTKEYNDLMLIKKTLLQAKKMLLDAKKIYDEKIKEDGYSSNKNLIISKENDR